MYSSELYFLTSESDIVVGLLNKTPQICQFLAGTLLHHQQEWQSLTHSLSCAFVKDTVLHYYSKFTMHGKRISHSKCNQT
jgi:hypothetical protein